MNKHRKRDNKTFTKMKFHSHKKQMFAKENEKHSIFPSSEVTRKQTGTTR